MAKTLTRTKTDRQKFEDMLGEAVVRDVRICFGLAWFASEEEAEEFGRLSAAVGNTINGGWFHGMTCGRSTQFDFVKEGQKLFAASY
ncbi:hypothetical protein DLP05_148 [Stenotrophomonas phage vB_SmaS_DLP_5]|uniref:Uncharacterized protein n=1 Tax=Stenotrophomonas phage vB_SmaS_DLP_5 TaxID=2044561 RepID=A0A2D2W2L8_9CAUD|nr:hypothetical protein FDJ07_gp073 [Stenotrophomonas phage vB_SmaS_DLP_5]ATS92384.1 hypothetical protein DLP05_148 [Stenotrophomonas phage vB_SmaS_DLP_5]